jgi:predicted PurR-regulated permease PerM
MKRLLFSGFDSELSDTSITDWITNFTQLSADLIFFIRFYFHFLYSYHKLWEQFNLDLGKRKKLFQLFL